MTAPSAKRMRRCHEGKVKHPTLQAAQETIRRMCERKAKQGNPVVSFMRAYGCACGSFHIGKTRDIDWSRVK